MCTQENLDLAGAYEGERLFLIGNGPSLKETPLEELESEYTMAMNRIDLIYDTVAWRPDFYICIHETINQTPFLNSVNVHVNMNDVLVFLNESHRNHVQSGGRINFLNVDDPSLHDQRPRDLTMADIENIDIEWLERFWSYDPREIVYQSHTMYVAVQLAMWMGFKQIYILGADLGIGTDKYMIIDNKLDPVNYGNNPVSYLVKAWEENKLLSAIVNGFALKFMNVFIRSKFSNRFTAYATHFDESYTNYVYSTEKDLETLKGHLVIKRICDSNGLDVYNATLGGQLEVYPRVNLIEILRH